MSPEIKQIDPREHYTREVGPIEHDELEECQTDIRNVGWTLGNACPYECPQCYSLSARERGANLTPQIIDRIIDQLSRVGVTTVNLGGNEPFFTNGLDRRNTLLPYIINGLVAHNILVGLTTSGISVVYLEEDYPQQFNLLNDIDVSLDSPSPEEHNRNRGAALYSQAIKALSLAREHEIDRTIVMCAMNWNFTPDRIKALVDTARKFDANVRINTIKPVEPEHMSLVLTGQQFYEGFSLLMNLCDPVDLGEPPLATVTNYEGAKGCPCGRTSFRIHSMTPDGKIPVSPCVYLHDYKAGDLTKDKLPDIIESPQFKTFRRRNAHPEAIVECRDCSLIDKCRGGCASRSYLHHAHQTGKRSLFVKDPYCPRDYQLTNHFPQNPQIDQDITLVHKDYLCSWIGKPR
ncbi:MAG: pyrroloquinoline quinone biosynthesis protein PqqE [Microgenomates group bacterium ADurb.Bin219]|nr:MAG: pyrroloquinoline quinone biosynthesis protein PqqE [Microgenomates group bacterium ADurb.Bin219]